MELKLFKTLWGHRGSLEQAIGQATQANMQGIEGPAPSDASSRRIFGEQLDANGLGYIAEITTAGSYVPDRNASLSDHLASFGEKLHHSLELEPIFITCLGGCDAWPESQSIDFFCSAMELAHTNNVTVSFETHRGRSFFNPWVTKRIVEQVPAIKLTCDFSHWCVVCERLMDSEIDVIKGISSHAHHIHARVGYDQGPQVPHPAAPEYRDALHAHQQWWEILWQAQREQGYMVSTMTPEFGPDGYLHEIPFKREPVADLWELNCWMANEERRHYQAVMR